MSGKRSLVPVALRLALGGIFLYAGVTKVADPEAFAGSIAAYRLLPYFGNYLLAATLPWLEILCALLLVSGLRLRAAAAIAIVLNLIFIAAIASTIARGLDVDCGCFRHGGAGTSPWAAIWRDLLLLAMAGWLLRRKEAPAK